MPGSAKIPAKYNVTTEFRELGLHAAALTGNIGLVRYALANGQPINSVQHGILPLHAACTSGNADVVRELLAAGADVNAPRLPRRYSNDRQAPAIGVAGSTPLHFAAASGHEGIIRLLLEAGADPTRGDKNGVTPVEVAESNGYVDASTLLRLAAAGQLISEHSGEAVAGPSTGGFGGVMGEGREPRLHIKRSLDNLLHLRSKSHSPAGPLPRRSTSPGEGPRGAGQGYPPLPPLPLATTVGAGASLPHISESSADPHVPATGSGSGNTTPSSVSTVSAPVTSGLPLRSKPPTTASKKLAHRRPRSAGQQDTAEFTQQRGGSLSPSPSPSPGPTTSGSATPGSASGGVSGSGTPLFPPLAAVTSLGSVGYTYASNAPLTSSPAASLTSVPTTSLPGPANPQAAGAIPAHRLHKLGSKYSLRNLFKKSSLPHDRSPSSSPSPYPYPYAYGYGYGGEGSPLPSPPPGSGDEMSIAMGIGAEELPSPGLGEGAPLPALPTSGGGAGVVGWGANPPAASALPAASGGPGPTSKTTRSRGSSNSSGSSGERELPPIPGSPPPPVPPLPASVAALAGATGTTSSTAPTGAATGPEQASSPAHTAPERSTSSGSAGGAAVVADRLISGGGSSPGVGVGVPVGAAVGPLGVGPVTGRPRKGSEVTAPSPLATVVAWGEGEEPEDVEFSPDSGDGAEEADVSGEGRGGLEAPSGEELEGEGDDRLETPVADTSPDTLGGTERRGILQRSPSDPQRMKNLRFEVNGESSESSNGKVDPYATVRARERTRGDSLSSGGSASASLSATRSAFGLDMEVTSLDEARELVQETQRAILAGFDASPSSSADGSLPGLSLEQQLAAYGETLAIEREFARREEKEKERQKREEDRQRRRVEKELGFGGRRGSDGNVGLGLGFSLGSVGGMGKGSTVLLTYDPPPWLLDDIAARRAAQAGGSGSGSGAATPPSPPDEKDKAIAETSPRNGNAKLSPPSHTYRHRPPALSLPSSGSSTRPRRPPHRRTTSSSSRSGSGYGSVIEEPDMDYPSPWNNTVRQKNYLPSSDPSHARSGSNDSHDGLASGGPEIVHTGPTPVSSPGTVRQPNSASTDSSASTETYGTYAHRIWDTPPYSSGSGGSFYDRDGHREPYAGGHDARGLIESPSEMTLVARKLTKSPPHSAGSSNSPYGTGRAEDWGGEGTQSPQSDTSLGRRFGGLPGIRGFVQTLTGR